MPEHPLLEGFNWQLADLRRGLYRPPTHHRVILAMTVLRRFDCVLAKTHAKALAEHKRRRVGGLNNAALDQIFNGTAGPRVHLAKLGGSELSSLLLRSERHEAVIEAALTVQLDVGAGLAGLMTVSPPQQLRAMVT
jgi:hypothetical protein